MPEPMTMPEGAGGSAQARALTAAAIALAHRRDPALTGARPGVRPGTVLLPGGAVVDLSARIRELRSVEPPSAPVDPSPQAMVVALAEDLVATASAMTTVGRTLLGRWDDQAERLGLVIRRPDPARIGVQLGRHLMVAVALAVEDGLIVVDRTMAARWGRRPAAVFDRARSRKPEASVLATGPITPPLDPAARPGRPVDGVVMVGDWSTAGLLVRVTELDGVAGPHGALAVPLGDGALAVAPLPVGCPRVRRELARALAEVVAPLGAVLGAQRGPVVWCQPRGRLVIVDDEAPFHDHRPARR